MIIVIQYEDGLYNQGDGYAVSKLSEADRYATIEEAELKAKELCYEPKVITLEEDTLVDYVYVLMIKDDECEHGWNTCEVFSTEDAAIQAAYDNSPNLRMEFKVIEDDPLNPYMFAYDGILYSYSIYKREIR